MPETTPSGQTSSSSTSKIVVICLIIFAILAVAAGVVVLTMSFSYLEYHEYGFKQEKSSGRVWLHKVYTGGRYFLGPGYNFVVYSATAQELDITNIGAFTRDRLQVKINARMQYFLRLDELSLLHRSSNGNLEDDMKTNASDVIQGIIPMFTINELIRNRSNIEEILRKALRERLGGPCCRPNCSQYEDACPLSCKPVKVCNDMDKGLHVDVVHFQLGKIEIASNVIARYMQVLILPQNVLTERLLQEAEVIRKQTDEIVSEIKNQAKVIVPIATSEAKLITDFADVNYERVTEEARIIAMAKSFRSFDMSDEQRNISYDYLRTMINNATVSVNIDFDRLIAGEL